ncbi:MAG: MarC family protein [Arachidicoccus sp.]|nr:MarC family protein [Arachidicoccus sp.]
MSYLSSFLHLAFIAFITLFPAVNPVGTAFIVSPLLDGLDRKQRLLASKKIAFYCLVICIVSVLLGSWILKIFGLSLPIVQIAGGMIIFNMGWQLLASKNENRAPERVTQPADKFREVQNLLFYPITFPMTAGAGTISVLLTLSASSGDKDFKDYIMDMGSVLVGALMIIILFYICIANTGLLFKTIGDRGQQVVNRISAFLVTCIGLQIFWNGLQHILKLHS